jgi:mycobactin phenyloxazoline synthetase
MCANPLDDRYPRVPGPMAVGYRGPGAGGSVARLAPVRPPAAGLHEPFFALAQAWPHRPAVLGPDGALGYRELAGLALRVAAALRARGVAAGDPVAVHLAPGPERVAAVLGVLAAGGCHVPVGAGAPPDRVARMALSAGFRVRLAGAAGPGVLTVAEAFRATPLAAPLPAGPHDPACLRFLPGRTGEPVLLRTPHRALHAVLTALVDRFGLGPADRTLAVSPPELGLSEFELFAPLRSGGAVVPATRADPRHRAALLARHRVSVLHGAAGTLTELLDATAGPVPASLRLVLAGGGPVDPELPARLATSAPGCRFAALGGAEEAGVHATVHEPEGLPGGRWLPYGRPLPGVALRVVDEHGRDQPDWAAGELWIGGAGVADGYHGDPAGSACRFVEHAGRRWYRTGDLCRYRPDGSVEYLGRRDERLTVPALRARVWGVWR